MVLNYMIVRKSLWTSQGELQKSESEQIHQGWMCASVNSLKPGDIMYVRVNWVITGSHNGLAPVRRQAIIWSDAELLSIIPEGIYLNGIQFETQRSLQLRKYIWIYHLQHVDHFSWPQYVYVT